MHVSTQTLGKLVALDKQCDWVPVISTVSSIVDLFIKTVVLPFKSGYIIHNNIYYTHLHDKSFTRCITLLIPIFGNLAVKLYDFTAPYTPNLPENFHDALELVKNRPSILKKVPYTPSNMAMIENLVAAWPHSFDEIKSDPRWLDNEKVMLAASQFSQDNLRLASVRLKNDRAFMIQVISIHPKLWSLAGPQLWDDEKYVHLAIKIDVAATGYATPRLKQTDPTLRAHFGQSSETTDPRTTALEKVRRDGCSLENSFFREDPEVVAAAIRQNPRTLKLSPLKNDPDFMLKMLQENGNLLPFAGEGIKRSEAHIEAAIKSSPEVIQYSSLNKDREYMKRFLQTYGFHYLSAAHYQLLNEGFLLECIRLEREQGTCVTWHAYIAPNLPLKNDQKFIQRALQANGHLLGELSDSERNNPNLVFQACLNTPEAIQYARQELMKNEPFVKSELSKGNALALKYAPAFQSKKEQVMVAVAANGKALEHVSEDLTKDLEIIEKAISNDPRAIVFAHPTVLASRNEMLPLFKKYPAILQYLPCYQNDKEAITAANLPKAPTESDASLAVEVKR